MQSGATFSIAYFDERNIQSGTFEMPTGTRLAVASDEIRVNPGVVIFKDGSFGSTGDEIGTLTLLGINSRVTHSPYPTNGGAGLQLTVGGTLTVGPSAQIEAIGDGLRGGDNGSAFGAIGETWNAAGTAAVSGATGRSSGSYGGMGGADSTFGSANPAYGLLESPSLFGSGGASQGNGGGAGDGGGGITIRAGTVVVQGRISADGDPASNNGNLAGVGGGSGGSIRMECGTLSTSTGREITARGGAGVQGSGGGGGGGESRFSATT